MGLLDALFGGGGNQAKELLDKGAVVIDVRTPAEFAGGHVKGSKNIPLQTIQSKVNDIKKLNKPVVACCASGMRSGQATDILQRAGIEAVNGGPWTKVNSLVG
ncbi:MAG: rhodanese-like domain-containing protein [Flavobacteriales bacterium]